MKPIKPRDLVKRNRPILINTSGLSREQLRRVLITALQTRGIKILEN